MSLIIVGDYTSVYVGLRRGVDPTPVEVLDRLKADLAGARGDDELGCPSLAGPPTTWRHEGAAVVRAVTDLVPRVGGGARVGPGARAGRGPARGGVVRLYGSARGSHRPGCRATRAAWCSAASPGCRRRRSSAGCTSTRATAWTCPRCCRASRRRWAPTRWSSRPRSGRSSRTFRPVRWRCCVDHLNMMGTAPMRGWRFPDGMPAFVPMQEVYDASFATLALARAEALSDRGGLRHLCRDERPGVRDAGRGGVPAGAGATVVGMSMVPEAVPARALGLRVWDCAR